jgi:hypothetical protein
MARPIYRIAEEIALEWKEPYFAAVPYIRAMRYLSSLDDYYITERGRDIVMYFLDNASTWRGDKARDVKNELRAMLRE